jgi:hypothetical protein
MKTILSICNTKSLKALLCSALISSASALAGDGGQQMSHISFATGSVNGVYYPAGGIICKLINENKDVKTKCFTESTSGSVGNLISSRTNKSSIGFSQNDWLYYSSRGEGIFKDYGADESLRTLFTLHTEAFYLIVKKDSQINSVDDLVGKNVSIGLEQSGMRWTIQRLFEMTKVKQKDLKKTFELKPSDEIKSFCEGQIDAMFMIYGSPNPITRELIESCDAKLVGIDDKYIAELVKKYPFYSKAFIKKGLYNDTQSAIKTLGIKSSVFTTTELSDETAYQIAKIVSQNLQSLSQASDVFKDIKPNEISQGGVVPLHNGSLRYFKEAGFVK